MLKTKFNKISNEAKGYISAAIALGAASGMCLYTDPNYSPPLMIGAIIGAIGAYDLGSDAIRQIKKDLEDGPTLEK